MKSELVRLLGFTAENLVRLAVVVRELELRGQDLSGIKMGLLPILRQIASGELLPEVVVMYAGQPGAIKKIAAMPLPEQERVARREVVVDASAGMRKIKGHDEPSRVRLQRDDDDDDIDCTIRGISHAGSPKDVGEMAARLVLESVDRKAAIRSLFCALVEEGVLPSSVAEVLPA